jgi:hypothetical protein
MNTEQEFTKEEVNLAKETIEERYQQPIDVEMADVELRLDPSSNELSYRPALYWEARDCHFVIIKVARGQFRNQFYFRGSEQSGTGVEEFDDIRKCAKTLLQIQADHETNRQEES